MKNLWILILSITILSCNKNKKEANQSVEHSTNNKIETIPVEPDGGIGDGALSIIDHHLKNIEQAHQKDNFLKHKAVRFSIDILFGGKQHLTGDITMLTNATKIRIDKKDGSQLLYTKEKVFLSPKEATDKQSRFDMFTWTYFLGLPYKLNDPGTQWELEKMRPLRGVEHQTARLTFDKGIGDSSDDWYVIYSDPKDHLLKAAAYIVTYGSDGDISKAQEDPHAIYYKDFKTIDDIPFATKWEFYTWREDKGGITDKLGEASITNITFLDEEGSLFDIPENAKEIKQ
ncbi:DUF6503 family protein [Aquimarina aquimarini]|uniref:DUF6503 family protein n=1 Tax=Aquimarina aquimarini TaxID=1191734 RepID=UPI000D55C1FD|nr:DUF6503 family protein [Aquimarina aquimarini]